MLRGILSHRPSPSMVVAVIAVIAATTGTALGAGALRDRRTVTASANVKTLAKKYAKQYAKKYARVYAKRGPAGSPGIAGIAEVDSQILTLAPGQTSLDIGGTGFRATCPAGSTVVGTGFNGSVGHTSFVTAYGSFVGGFFYNDSSISHQVHVQAVCARNGASAAATQSLRRAEAKYHADQQRTQLRYEK
jgi:hypothetical protein